MKLNVAVQGNDDGPYRSVRCVVERTRPIDAVFDEVRQVPFRDFDELLEKSLVTYKRTRWVNARRICQYMIPPGEVDFIVVKFPILLKSKDDGYWSDYVQAFGAHAPDYPVSRSSGIVVMRHDEDSRFFERVSIHEIGHALGIADHCPESRRCLMKTDNDDLDLCNPHYRFLSERYNPLEIKS